MQKALLHSDAPAPSAGADRMGSPASSEFLASNNAQVIPPSNLVIERVPDTIARTRTMGQTYVATKTASFVAEPEEAPIDVEEMPEPPALEINLSEAEEQDLAAIALPTRESATSPRPITAQDREGLRLKWVALATHRRIGTRLGQLAMQLARTASTSTPHTTASLHARALWVHSFCGYASKWRETVRKHQRNGRNHCDPDGPVYEVDAVPFPSLRKGDRGRRKSMPRDPRGDCSSSGRTRRSRQAS